MHTEHKPTLILATLTHVEALPGNKACYLFENANQEKRWQWLT